MLSYRVGFPGWKIAARAGLRVKLRIDVLRDEEAKVFVARSPDLRGLVAEAETLDELVANLQAAVNDLMLHEIHAETKPRTELRFDGDDLCVA
jgi:predicted RNase H-like HicB family nuclease